MDFVGVFQRLIAMQLYRVILYYIDVLNLELMSDNTQLYRKSILSSRLSLLCCALYKPSELVGLMKTALPVC